MNPTERLANFIVNVSGADIPAEAFERAKWAVADGVAVILGGWRAIGPRVASFARNMGGRPDSTIIGSGEHAAPSQAAWANAVMSHILDYDDINENMGGHPTGPVLSAVLALGETCNASGSACLTAYLIGVETETKLGRAMIKTLYSRGWHPTSVLGVMGATAACGKLLNLTLDQTRMALGMAGSMAGGLKQNFGAMTKSLHVGLAAQNGVNAALLAQDGWTAATDILEGRFGFGRLFCGPEGFDFDEMTDHLGAPWDIIEPGFKLKKYPCCGSIHPAVDALLSLRGKYAWDESDVSSLTCFVHPQKQHILVHPRPETGLEAKFSLEYCLARAVVDGRISIDHFQDDAIRNERINMLMPRIIVRQDKDLPQWASRITIETKEGRRFNETCDQLPGIDSPDALFTKFNDCAEPVIGAERSKEIFHEIMHLDRLTGIRDLLRKLSEESS
jgi:2-methylcitrate dehydratase PrpD